MNSALQELMGRYAPQTRAEYESALREIVQELALLGLWRAKFYEHAAFYGGTALRIFHGLRRFSEDLDFSLLKPDATFDPHPYLRAVEEELTAFGFSVEVERRQKNIETAIESAFIKGETTVNLLRIGAPASLAGGLPRSQLVRIKMEIDTDPPPGAAFEVRTLLVPIPFQVKLYTPPDLFAGKVHAVLCRKWKNRVKGRDYYDFVWYVGRGTPCHLAHLESRMRQTGHWREKRDLTEADVRAFLAERFGQVDFDTAKNDVIPFLRDLEEVALWSPAFFRQVAEGMKFS